MIAKLGALVRVILCWVFSAVYIASCVLIVTLTLRQLSPKIVAYMHRIWGRAILRMLGVEFEEMNSSPFSAAGPRVIIVNHQSALDLVWVAAIAPPGLLAIGKKELLYVPVMNLAWWGFGHVRIDRKNTERALQSLKRVAALIVKKKRSLVIAPEGTRTPDGAILPFKKGGFRLAMQAQVPIYPVVVSGAYQRLPKGRWLTRPGVLRLEYLTPIETADWSLEDLDGHIARTRTLFVGALQRLDALN